MRFLFVVQPLVNALQETVEGDACLFHLFHDGLSAVLEDGGCVLALQLGHFLQLFFAEVVVGIDFLEQLAELFVSLLPLFLGVVFAVFWISSTNSLRSSMRLDFDWQEVRQKMPAVSKASKMYFS